HRERPLLVPHVRRQRKLSNGPRKPRGLRMANRPPPKTLQPSDGRSPASEDPATAGRLAVRRPSVRDLKLFSHIVPNEPKTKGFARFGGADVFPDGLGGQPQPPPAAGYRIVHLAPSLVERLQPPLPVPADPLGELGGEPLGGDPAPVPPEIGRASCRESACVWVDGDRPTNTSIR